MSAIAKNVQQMLASLDAKCIDPQKQTVALRMGGAVASLRPSGRGDCVYVMHIRTDANCRGQGFASEILDHICCAADQFGVELFLEVERGEGGGLSEAELMDWYWKFGFRGNRQEMIREPKERHAE